MGLSNFYRRRSIAPPGHAAASLALAFSLALCGAASAQTINNGSFETNPGTFNATGSNISNWTVSNTGTQFGPTCEINNNNFTNCGFGAENTGGLISNLGTDPAGPNYFGAATWTNTSVSISQTVSGLIANHFYVISFYQAGVEDTANATGDDAFWKVTFGGAASQTSPAMSFSTQDYVAWTSNKVSLIFKADNTSDTLTFLAAGGTNTGPPMALLDGVTISQAPEPASLALLGMGTAGVTLLRRSRRRRGARGTAAAA